MSLMITILDFSKLVIHTPLLVIEVTWAMPTSSTLPCFVLHTDQERNRGSFPAGSILCMKYEAGEEGVEITLFVW